MPDTIALTAPPAGRVAEVILHFTPNWFAACMGTGILAVALGQFPASPWLHGTGQALYLANTVLFLLFASIYVLKWLRHRHLAAQLFRHPVQSMFLGTIPMAVATILNGTLIYGPALYGEVVAVEVAMVLWFVDAALALAIGIGVPFLMFTRQSHSIADMSAVWLLPVVAAEVAAASGLLLLPHFADAAALAMLVGCIVYGRVRCRSHSVFWSSCSCAWCFTSCRRLPWRPQAGLRSGPSAPARLALPCWR